LIFWVSAEPTSCFNNHIYLVIYITLYNLRVPKKYCPTSCSNYYSYVVTYSRWPFFVNQNLQVISREIIYPVVFAHTRIPGGEYNMRWRSELVSVRVATDHNVNILLLLLLYDIIIGSFLFTVNDDFRNTRLNNNNIGNSYATPRAVRVPLTNIIIIF